MYRGIYNSTPPTLVDGEQAQLQVDEAGGLKIATTVPVPISTEINTVAWTHVADQTLTATVAATLLAAGVATQELMITNNDGSNSLRLRFDNSDATSTVGISIPPGQGWYFGPGSVPAGKISGYSDGAISVSVAYV